MLFFSMLLDNSYDAFILLSTLSLLSWPVIGATVQSVLADRASPGCGKPHTAVGATRKFPIESKCCPDVTAIRNYSIHLPTNYNRHNPTALIISYHGANETPRKHEKDSQLSNELYNPDMIVVYPEGVDVSFRLSNRPKLCRMPSAEPQFQPN